MGALGPYHSAVPLYAYRGKRPRVAPDAWVAPTASVIGDVEIASGASVWFGATVRGDMSYVRIGPRTSVQDNCVIHTEADGPTVIGADVTLGHGAIVHNSEIGDNVLIGMGSVLVGGARVGSGSVIAAGAVLPAAMEVPPGKVVVGVPARVVRDARAEDARWTVHAAEHYVDLSAWYREHLTEA
jgi:carbonic anhydrase/acetyltransferase-like protein (isoleucine patch superfamily)